MPDNSLINSLIAQQGGTGSQDPALLSLLPKLSLAQSMIQQGSDTSAAYPAQALARLAQAFGGNYLLGNTTSAISDTLGQRQKALAASLLGSTPTGQAPLVSGTLPTPAIPGGPNPSSAPGVTPQVGAAGDLPAPSVGGMGVAGTAAPGGTLTPVGQMRAIAAKLINSGDPVLMQRGNELLLQSTSAEANAEAEAHGKMLAAGQNYDPVTGTVTAVNGFNPTAAATKQAESTGSELGKVAPNVVQAQIGATNLTNLGTMGTDAAKAGAVSNATAMGANAPNVAGEEAQKAYRVAQGTGLGASAPDVTASEAEKAAIIAKANAGVRAQTEPGIAAATTTATNQANVAKPLTPEQINTQEQTASQDFSNNEIVKRHGEAAQAYLNVVKAAQDPTKAGDIGLVDSLVKMFNPQATVRQATFENFMEHSQGLPDNIKGLVAAYYSNGEHLQPDTRQQLLAQATNYMNSSRQAYQGVASFARQQAQAHGLNPNNVVRPIIDPLTAQEELARRQAVAGGLPAPQQGAGQ